MNVLNEQQTLDAVSSGRSLARYGDGEIALAQGRGIPCQIFDRGLSEGLRGILLTSGRCLVGIPRLARESPKYGYWAKRIDRTLLADRVYASAFVTRPDSAPWINTAAYWSQIEALWVGQDVTLVRGGDRSLVAADLAGAHVTEIIGPAAHAWSEAPRLLERIHAVGNRRVLLCLGPTATVLAVDLCAHGFHAIDLGHVGMFLKKYRRGELMTVTTKDKQEAALEFGPATLAMLHTRKAVLSPEDIRRLYCG